MSVPNQRIIYIHKENKPKDQFVALNIDVMKAVYCDLKNAYTFYLYLCLCANKNGYKMEFSPKGIAVRFGLHENTARDQFKKLVEKGYLIPPAAGHNIYNFYAEPPHIKEQLGAVPFEVKQEKKVNIQDVLAAVNDDMDAEPIIPKPANTPPFKF